MKNTATIYKKNALKSKKRSVFYLKLMAATAMLAQVKLRKQKSF